MPNAKRASMREGPLTALFRKTAEDTGAPTQTRSRRTVDSERAARREPSARPSADAHAPARPPRLEEPAAAPVQTPIHAEETQPRRALASPRRRSVCATRSRPTSPRTCGSRQTRRPAPSPEPDVYARPERRASAFAAPKPVGTPVLRVVGVGGAGVNAVNRMVEAEIEGVEFLAINTDLQSLQQSAAHETLHIGDSITRGLGSGSNPDLGRQAAREEYDRIKAMLRGSDMVFIAAGAGGGTGTGAAPIVAQIAREIGALTVGIVTRPFQFEGSRRRDQAEAGIDALADEVDTLIVVPNNRLLSVLDRNTSMVEAFRVADDVLRQGVQGISDLVTLPGLINLDFADVRTIMSDAGNALLGIGMGVRRAPRDRRRRAGGGLAAAGDEHGGRALDPAVDHRRARPVAVGGQRGGQGGGRGGPPGRQHHLRRDARREARRPGMGHGRGDRLRRGRAAADAMVHARPSVARMASSRPVAARAARRATGESGRLRRSPQRRSRGFIPRRCGHDRADRLRGRSRAELATPVSSEFIPDRR